MAEERINYNDISSSCSNLTNLASSMSETSENIQSAINQITDPTWDGTAATSYVEKLRSLCNHLPDANRQLAEAVLFLASCADGYKSIEDATVQKLKEIIGGQSYIDSYDVSKAPDIDPSSRVTLEKPQTEEPKNETTTPKNETTNRAATGGNTSGGTVTGGGSSGYVTAGGGAAVTGGVVSASQQSQVKEKEKENETKSEKVESLKKGEKSDLPSSLEQSEYKTKTYDKDNKFETNSDEKAVETLWKSQGSNFEDGIATIKVDGEERYLVKVSPKYGKVGDSIDVNLKDGSVVKCVIAENKSIEGPKANPYGTANSDGKVNVLEFESKTLSQNENIQYQWDKNSPVTRVSNNGSILNNKAEATKIIENKTYPVPASSETTAPVTKTETMKPSSGTATNGTTTTTSDSVVNTSAETTTTTTESTNATSNTESVEK